MRLVSLLVVGSLACAHAPTPARSTIEGVWEPTSYRLATGETHPVTGQIFFASQRWTVLFFVRDGEGEVRRGSAEGGRYSVDGSRLTFVHDYHLSSGSELPGLPAAELRMEVRDAAAAAEEPVEVELGVDVMTISFPSGNAMEFRRIE